jgi:cytochrome c oxidase assembly factor 2
LFAGTLLASFIVVGIPHVFPCPVPRKNYADTERQLVDKDGNPLPRRNRPTLKNPSQTSAANSKANSRSLQEEAELFRQLQLEAEILEKEARECPVPKPKGWIGRVLGFDSAQPPPEQSAKG